MCMCVGGWGGGWVGVGVGVHMRVHMRVRAYNLIPALNDMMT